MIRMNRVKPVFFAVMSGALVLLQAPAAHAASAPQCPFTPDELKSALGETFAPGVPMQGVIGKACEYRGKDHTLGIDAGPMPMPSADMWRKISSPPGTKWAAVPGDPDKAYYMVKVPNGSLYPNLMYERKGWLVNLVGLLGIDSDNKALLDAWNVKLRKLRRIP